MVWHPLITFVTFDILVLSCILTSGSFTKSVWATDLIYFALQVLSPQGKKTPLIVEKVYNAYLCANVSFTNT